MAHLYIYMIILKKYFFGKHKSNHPLTKNNSPYFVKLCFSTFKVSAMRVGLSSFLCQRKTHPKCKRCLGCVCKRNPAHPTIEPTLFICFFPQKCKLSSIAIFLSYLFFGKNKNISIDTFVFL